MAAKRKALRKKTTKSLGKKAATGAAKKTAGKMAAKAKTSAKSARKQAATRSAGSPEGRAASASRGTSRVAVPGKSLLIEPGPPAGAVPPVEEPIPTERAVGVVTHYYGHLGVAVVQINTGVLRTGDSVHIKGHTTDLRESIGSMEYEHQHVDEARPGQSVGIRVADHVREHDIVYTVR